MKNTANNSLIPCRSIYGKTVLVPRERLVFRPSVYAAIRYEDMVLLVQAHSTGKYMFPGGGVEPGERLEEALLREVREETGLDVEVERFAAFQESFFYYDPGDSAYHAYLFFYHCHPLNLDPHGLNRLIDEEAEQPAWVPLASLRAGQFQSHPEVYANVLGITLEP